jgi:hypothetical protein
MATTEIQEALAAFTFFPELPTKLQLTIWEYAIPESQIIPIEVFGYRRSRSYLRWWGHYERDRFRTKISASGLLGAFKSSRETILKRYNVCIESGAIRLLPWLWGNSRKDKHNDYVRKFAGIKHLAIDWFQDHCWGPIVRAYILSHFESLEKREPHLFCLADISRIDGWEMGGTWYVTEQMDQGGRKNAGTNSKGICCRDKRL